MTRKEIAIRIIGLLKSYSLVILISLGFAIISVVCNLYTPILVGQAIDSIIGTGQVNFVALSPIFFKFGFFIIFTGILQWIMGLCNSYLVCKVSQKLRQTTFEHLHHLPISTLDSLGVGDIVSRMGNDIEQINEGLLLGFSQLFTGIATIFATLFFMLSLHWKIALMVVLLTPISFLVASFIAKKSFIFFQKQARTGGELTRFVQERIEHQKTVQALCLSSQTKEDFERLNHSYADFATKGVFFSSLTNPCTRFVNHLIYLSVGILGAFSALAGNISIGGLSCFLSYANQYTKPFNEISSVISEFQNALAGAGRIFQLLDLSPEPADKQDCIVLENPNGAISFDNLSFGYEKNKPVLQDINLLVKPGQHIAIVGSTGCGKTTLINLLMRFYHPNQGSICFESTNISRFTQESWRKNLGMVLQDTWLCHGTVHDNIAYGVGNASREQVIQAAKAAFADDFITKLPNGYDTVIGSSGCNLSQGQKQLLCIARVILQQPTILILDEATSSIDTRTEQKIQQAFDLLMQGRTSFIVAHRLSTIQNADVILVMKDGKIVEQGCHIQLISQKGVYWELYSKQFCKIV